MIVIDNFQVQDTEHFVAVVEEHPYIATQSEDFVSKSLSYLPRERKCIYVLQGETASVEYKADNGMLFSDDATTCVICVLVCKATGMAAIAHFDENTSKSELCWRKFVRQLFGGRELDVYLVGGMKEDSGVGYRTVNNLLANMHTSKSNFNIRMACVHKLNTLPSGAPLRKGFAFDPLTCSFYYSSMDSRGPGLEQRLARYWLLSSQITDLVNVYDPHDQEFVLAGYAHTVPRWLMVNSAYLLTLDDETLLNKTSTTPIYESREFVSDIRIAMKFILSHSEKPFTFFTRSFNWEPALQQWMEVGNKTDKLSRVNSLEDLRELPIDVPGSSWSHVAE